MAAWIRELCPFLSDEPPDIKLTNAQSVFDRDEEVCFNFERKLKVNHGTLILLGPYKFPHLP